MENTKDPVNQHLVCDELVFGTEQLGLMSGAVWRDDPKRLIFTLSRYKFVAKMLAGKNKVVEIGCGDGFCSRVVAQSVVDLTITDYDPLFIEKFNNNLSKKWKTKAITHDILKSPLLEKFEALYSLDVLEHIPQKQEDIFLGNCKESLKENGVAIIGMPSLESQCFASPASKAGHVNCKTGQDFKITLERHFANVFLFSMNDEVVHTGFEKMAHYLICLCVV
jgi:2-polyprenyl-3-methyl-5-hydroxy-6-metoxy-1,4-benzoquinol methylase